MTVPCTLLSCTTPSIRVFSVYPLYFIVFVPEYIVYVAELRNSARMQGVRLVRIGIANRDVRR